jgi:ribosome-associated protein YbcJ (S4-like RNA binding protein)
MPDTGRTSIPDLQKPSRVVKNAQDANSADSRQTKKLLNGSRSGGRKMRVIENKNTVQVGKREVAQRRKISERDVIWNDGKLLDVADEVRGCV